MASVQADPDEAYFEEIIQGLQQQELNRQKTDQRKD